MLHRLGRICCVFARFPCGCGLGGGLDGGPLGPPGGGAGGAGGYGIVRVVVVWAMVPVVEVRHDSIRMASFQCVDLLVELVRLPGNVQDCLAVGIVMVLGIQSQRDSLVVVVVAVAVVAVEQER